MCDYHGLIVTYIIIDFLIFKDLILYLFNNFELISSLYLDQKGLYNNW